MKRRFPVNKKYDIITKFFLFKEIIKIAPTIGEDNMKLAEKTWEEVQEYLKEKKELIVPVSICEQHSTHLPLNTDTLLAEYICGYLSDQCNILIAPTINYGVGLPCDRFYPGTTTITFEDLKNTVSSLTEWWHLQGFEKIFILSAHGDPFHLKALEESRDHGIYVFEIYDIELDDILEKQITAKHAGEAETSVMLYLYPDKVRKDKIKDFETPIREFAEYLLHKKTDPIPGCPGCQGYPCSGTVEKGKIIVERMKKISLEWIKKKSSGGLLESEF